MGFQGVVWRISIVRLFVVVVLRVIVVVVVVVMVFFIVNRRCLDRGTGSFHFDTGTTSKWGQIVAIGLRELGVDEIRWQWRVFDLG